MKIEVINTSVVTLDCDALIINLFEGASTLDGAASAIDKALNGNLAKIMQAQSDCGKYGNIRSLYSFGMLGAKNIILLGLGKQEELTHDKIRALSAIALREANKLHSRTVATIVHGAGSDNIEPITAVQAVIEGAILGTYQFDHYKTQDIDPMNIETLIIIEPDKNKTKQYKSVVNTAMIIAESVNFTRDLVNHPAGYLTPTKMAEFADQIAAEHQLKIDILDKANLEKLGMNSFLAVAQGSTQPPKLIVLTYKGNPSSKDTVAFVGKGITFDSGGISLKPDEGMRDMKGDMAGGAAVLGALKAIAALKLQVNVIGIVPCTENMPSGSAIKPGDIVKAMSGKTIEIITTDAEGRLILADALSYAKMLGANKIVDLATLTGACVVALGTLTTGLISNNRNWCNKIIDAAHRAGEKVWELPAFEEYKEQIKSSVADLKNTGGRPAGAITAGLFLATFAEDTPWVHMDIAGTSDTDKTQGYNIIGGTGAGVRTLVTLATQLENEKS